MENILIQFDSIELFINGELQIAWYEYLERKSAPETTINVTGMTIMNQMDSLRYNLAKIKKSYIELLYEAYEAQKQLAKYSPDY